MMRELRRRGFLTLLAVATAAGVTGCVSADADRAVARPSPIGPPAAAPPSPVAHGSLLAPPPPSARVRLPGGGTLSRLPGGRDLLALTVDDGVSTQVVRAYTKFASDTGVRLTFFVNGIYRSWTDNQAALRPLVDSGQIQLGNHTWSHPDLTKVTKDRVVEELSRNDRFLKSTYGINAAPYYRPPYGKRNAAVDSIAGGLGYTVPVLWSGSLADSSLITEEYIMQMANQYFTPQTIVIGHLNHLPVTHVYPQLVELIRARNLRTVTLNDVFLAPG
jgi:peptidoglycan/xylan/chitin deacetylase (PgdA/CDA1 family)